MVRIRFRVLCAALPLFWLAAYPCLAKYGGGLGTADQPYLIYTAAQMNQIGADSNDWDRHFALMADIDLGIFAPDGFNLIGIDTDEPFSGVFDGRGHIISNFTYEKEDVAVGLFRIIADGGVVQNLGLAEPNISARTAVGTLAGSLEDGTIENCWVTGGYVHALLDDVGGLAGIISGGTVSNCYCRDTNIELYSVGGGLAASNDGGLIVNSYVSNHVYSLSDSTGAFVGADANGVYVGCFYNEQASPPRTGIGDGNDPCGLVGETTANLQLSATFVNAGWDIVTPDNQPAIHIWRLCEDGVDYPHLAVEYLAGDFACPDGVDTLDLAVFVDQWLAERLEADVDFDGDYRVTFGDWAVLAAAWKSTSGSGNYDPLADIYPYGGDGRIDEQDLAVFIEYWLDYGAVHLSADVSPYGGDGVVDLEDFAAFANQWLQGQ